MTVNIRGDQANRLAVASVIAREGLWRLKNHLVVPRLIASDYQEYFGMKIGDRFTIKLPFRSRVNDGGTLAATGYTSMVDKTVDFVVNFRKHFAFQMSATEMTLDLTDFFNRYFNASIEEFAFEYDIAASNEMMGGCFHVNGTPGTAIDLKAAQFVRAHATDVAIPRRSTNCALLSPTDIAELGEDLIGLYDGPLIGEGVRSTFMGRLAAWNVFESVHTNQLVCNDYGAGTPLVNMTSGYQGNMLPTDGWASSEQKVLNKGQLIQIANVNEIQPRGDRRETGRIATFVVTADVSSDASGNATIPIYPEINDGTLTTTGGDNDTITLKGFETVNAKAANNAAITVLGTKGTTYRQGMFFDKDVAQIASIPIIAPESAGWQGFEMDEETGLSVTITGDFDIANLVDRKRADVMGAIKTTYPELGVRFISDDL